MTVRPLQSAWRFSRNELSRKPGAVQISRWQQRAARAEALVALQKHVAALLGTPLTGEPSS
jgi:hypothetical protein